MNSATQTYTKSHKSSDVNGSSRRVSDYSNCVVTSQVRGGNGTYRRGEVNGAARSGFLKLINFEILTKHWHSKIGSCSWHALKSCREDYLLALWPGERQ